MNAPWNPSGRTRTEDARGRPARALLLALVYLLGVLNTQAAAQTQEPIWRDVSKVTFGDLHRRPPSVPLPPVSPEEVARWQNEIKGAVQAVPRDTFWNSVKAGGTQIVRNPLNLVKGGARLVGQGAVFQLGVLGVNAALQWAFGEFQREATQSTLATCMSNASAAGYSINSGMPCEVWYESTLGAFKKGAYPTALNQTEIWVYQKNSAGTLVNRFTVRLTYNEGNLRLYSVDAGCPGKGYGVSNAEAVYVEQAWSDFVEGCSPLTGQAEYKATLQDYVDGAQIGSKTIPPHPELKDQIQNTVINYINAHPPQPGPQGQIYPGMTLSPAPSASGWYGVPISIYDDEDGDGWSDWEEILRESDPNDTNSKPDPKRDTDGDGVADEIEDAQGTDPYDPASKPDPKYYEDLDGDGIKDADDPDEDGDGVPNTTDPAPRDKTIPINCVPGTVASPDGLSCVTKPGEVPQDEATCLNRGGIWTDGACTLPDTLPGLPTGQDSTLPEMKTGPIKSAWEATWNQVTNTAKDKFPFGLGSKLIPTGLTVGQECPSFRANVIPSINASVDLNICQGPAAVWMHDILRPLLGFLLVVGFLVSEARLAVKS